MPPERSCLRLQLLTSCWSPEYQQSRANGNAIASRERQFALSIIIIRRLGSSTKQSGFNYNGWHDGVTNAFRTNATDLGTRPLPGSV